MRKIIHVFEEMIDSSFIDCVLLERFWIFILFLFLLILLN